jgi:heat shock protein HtpX
LGNTANLMGQERDTFWQLERANRRKTVELVVIFILVYCLIGFALDLIFHTLRVVNHQLIGFPALTIAAAVIASAQALRAYYRGSSVLIRAAGAHDLTSGAAKTQMVGDVVDEMALAARIPRPRLCLMEDPAPNAFATGRDPANSVICVTRGLVDQLDREELQGVIAHEMAHIRGHDTRITQMATVMVGGFALVAGSIWRSAQKQRRGEMAAIPGFGLVAIPLFIAGGIGWLFSKTAAIALSRQREYLADASAVEFTRNPAALIRALEHIARIESPLKAALRGLAPLFIVDPSECGGPGWVEYLDEVARIEAQTDKSKAQRDAEVAQFMASQKYLKFLDSGPFGRFGR